MARSRYGRAILPCENSAASRICAHASWVLNGRDVPPKTSQETAKKPHDD